MKKWILWLSLLLALLVLFTIVINSRRDGQVSDIATPSATLAPTQVKAPQNAPQQQTDTVVPPQQAEQNQSTTVVNEAPKQEEPEKEFPAPIILPSLDAILNL